MNNCETTFFRIFGLYIAPKGRVLSEKVDCLYSNQQAKRTFSSFPCAPHPSRSTREREKGGEEKDRGKEREREKGGEREGERRAKEQKKKMEFKIAVAVEFPFLGLKDGRGLGDSSPPEGIRTLVKNNFSKPVTL